MTQKNKSKTIAIADAGKLLTEKQRNKIVNAAVKKVFNERFDLEPIIEDVIGKWVETAMPQIEKMVSNYCESMLPEMINKAVTDFKRSCKLRVEIDDFY